MSRKGRDRGQHGQERQAAILAAAVDLFQRQGYHATSMQDIADAVGLQKGSLYYYLSSKEELLADFMDHGMAAFNQRLEEVALLPLPAPERLRQAVRMHIEVIAEHQGMMTIFLREGHALAPPQQARVAEAIDRTRRVYMRILEDGIAAGDFRRVDVKMTCMAILGSCNWLYQWYRAAGPRSLDEITAAFTDLFLAGVLSER